MLEKELKKIKYQEQKKDLATFPSKLSILPLPIRKPNSYFYERSNGRDSIVIESGSWKNPKTGKKEHLGLPYGIYPRHILMYLSQEYLRNKAKNKNPRVINLPNTMPEFLAQLGYKKGGETYKRIYQQTLKLLEARIAIYKTGKNYILKEKHDITKKVALWWDPKNPKQETLPSFNCMVEITKMTEEWLKVVTPLKLSVIREIGDNCLEFNLYCLLNYRHYALRHPYTIGWAEIQEQLGANYKDLRCFKAKMRKVDANVRELYPHNSKFTEHGILLQNSNTNIIPTRKSEQKRQQEVIEGNKKRYKEGQEWLKRQPEYNRRKLI